MTSEISTQISAALLRGTSAVEGKTKSAVAPAEVVAPAENAQKSAANDNLAKTEEKATASPRENVPKEEVNQAIDEIKQQMSDIGRKINFSVDEDLNIVIIKVVNKDTEEIVRQLPSEEVVEIARNIQENKGLIFQEKV